MIAYLLAAIQGAIVVHSNTLHKPLPATFFFRKPTGAEKPLVSGSVTR
jgi:hypothetical protein